MTSVGSLDTSHYKRSKFGTFLYLFLIVLQSAYCFRQLKGLYRFSDVTAVAVVVDLILLVITASAALMCLFKILADAKYTIDPRFRRSVVLPFVGLVAGYAAALILSLYTHQRLDPKNEFQTHSRLPDVDWVVWCWLAASVALGWYTQTPAETVDSIWAFIRPFYKEAEIFPDYITHPTAVIPEPAIRKAKAEASTMPIAYQVQSPIYNQMQFEPSESPKSTVE